jgi:hypothetical protein
MAGTDGDFSDAEVFRGTFPSRGSRQTQRWAKGRRCEHGGCTTLISTYNRSTTCWVHQSSPPREYPVAS